MVNATNANIVTHNATDDQRTTKECQKHPRPQLLVVNYIKYDLIVLKKKKQNQTDRSTSNSYSFFLKKGHIKCWVFAISSSDKKNATFPLKKSNEKDLIS